MERRREKNKFYYCYNNSIFQMRCKIQKIEIALVNVLFTKNLKIIFISPKRISVVLSGKN